MNRKDVALDLAAVEDKLDAAEGTTYWQSLEELADTEAFQEMLHREFPENATEWAGGPVSRRRFLTLMGASLALAGLGGCSKGPYEKIVPYITQPEGMVPGKPQFYASALSLGGQVTGVLVESHMGRPTKIEGNPDHPASLGATDVFAQADILTMFDPDRSQTVTYLNRTRLWDDALTTIRQAIDAARGTGVRILTDAVTSPTLIQQLRTMLDHKSFQGAKVVTFEPATATAEAGALKSAFKDDVEAVYNIKDADVIVSLDADFLCGPGASIRYAKEFGARRRIDPTTVGKGHWENAALNKMNRLYAVETMPTPTGAIADHRLALKPSEIDAFARALAGKLGLTVKDADNPTAKKYAKWLDAIAADLNERDKGKTLIIAGAYQSAAVQHLALAMNETLGNIGKTVTFVPAVNKPELKPEQTQSLTELIADMNGGKVGVVLVLGANPCYTVPKALGFNEAFDKVKLRVHHGLFQDETAVQCHWHLPATHALEQWSDARTFDGTASIVQPLIAPLYQGRSAHEIIAALTDSKLLSAYDLVRDYWRAWHKANAGKIEDARAKADFELFWKQSLFRGVVGYVPPKEDGTPSPATTASKPKTLKFDLGSLAGLLAKDEEEQKEKDKEKDRSGETYEVNFRPDPAVFDGRYANNGWLQEFPKPITKITWDNVAYMSVATAKKLGCTFSFGRQGGEHGSTWVDKVTLKVGDREITLPAWITPGHADGSITLTLGYGRTHAGRVAAYEDLQSLGDRSAGVGVDVGPLRESADQWTLPGVTVTKVAGKYQVACTQAHHNLEGRDLLRTASFEKYFNEDHGHDDYRLAVHKSGHHGKKHGHKDDHDHDKKEEKHDHGTGEGVAYGQRKPLGLLPPDPQKPGNHRWGMVLNLGACTGCSACVVACQAENNIPVVGKDQVTKGREMHWIRIDRYYFTDPKQEEAAKEDKAREVGILHQPVPCQQCEKAPCEQVCPVSATVHSDDGLNDMVYNRCVGTRYCSNNCPYKVRRFNFLEFQAYANDTLKLVRNPDVTVRTRGVMEKCTYCVQRIRQAEIEARTEGRTIRDGEVVTACQAACAMGAIVFGDLGPADEKPTSLVGQLRALKELNYGLLDEDLQTHPRTTYLAALKNPNPKLLVDPKLVEEKKG